MNNEVLLDVRHLTQQFHLTKKVTVKAVDDVSFQIHRGEIFGLVGESGSGKSTVARCLMNIYQPAEGEIWYNNVNICDKKEYRKNAADQKADDLSGFCIQSESENESGRYYCRTNENPAYHTKKRKLSKRSSLSDEICRLREQLSGTVSI